MFHLLTSSVGILALASCVAPTKIPSEEIARASSVAEFLASIRTRGAALGCNTHLVEGILAARIEQPKVSRQGDIYRAEYKLEPSVASLVTSGSEYTQFRSSTTSFCQIKINLPEGALCGIYSEPYRAVVGARPVPYHPPHPPRSRTPDQAAFHLFGEGEAAQRDEAWLSIRHGERCVYEVIVRTRGTFQEVQ